MLCGLRYFKGQHDILEEDRKAIGENGQLFTVSNLPNNKIVDNQYRKVAEQKLNYLLGKPITVLSDNDEFSLRIHRILGKNFARIVRNIGQDALNCGIGWLYVHYNSQGEFAFKRFSPTEIIPIWKNSDHTRIKAFIRLFPSENQDDKNKPVFLAEIYRKDGIYSFFYNEGELIPQKDFYKPYFKVNGVDYAWNEIPLIPFKYNCDEFPLINMVKSLQDGINRIESDFLNVMQEDCRNSILVLVNYDGENLGEFRRNLATYGVVKVQGGEGGGDVRSLNVEVNSENYLAILNIFKKALIENAKAVDVKGEKIGLNSNQLTIKSMYSDIDLDANGMETEFAASIVSLLSLVKYHIVNTEGVSFDSCNVDVIFNRDMLMNESEIIDNLVKSKSILSDETIIAQHPWVNNVFEEKNRLSKEKNQME